MGLAKATAPRKAYGNDWHCMNSYIWCGSGEAGGMALVCGDTGGEIYAMYRELQIMFCESIP